jgi:hypothetical protein
MMIVRIFLTHHLGIRSGFLAHITTKTSRKNHIIGSSGNDVDRDLSKNSNWIESGMENSSIQ